MPPPDWSPYSVKYGDTVYSLAQQTGVTPEEVLRANCLATPSLSLDQKLYLPVKTCTPTQPTDWGVYVVRLGDTLYTLAVTRDTTVAEVKQTNCLVSDRLQEGQSLYLPPLRHPLPPPVAPPPLQLVEVSGVNTLPVLDLSPGQPGSQEIFTACLEFKGHPWIKVKDDLQQVELGTRVHFFACEFAPLIPLTATLSGPGTPQPLEVLPASPDPTFVGGTARGVVIWGADCDLTTEVPYTLTLHNALGQQEPYTFTLTPIEMGQILITPTAGTRFTVSYCYPGYAGRQVPFALYRATSADPTPNQKYDPVKPWNVLIGETGWTTADLDLPLGSPPGVYLVRDLLEEVSNHSIFWLSR